MTGSSATTKVEVTAETPSDVDDVYTALRGTPGITVTALSTPVSPGEQGAVVDGLMVALSSGAATAFLQIIKVLAESHGPKFKLKLRHGENALELSSDNVDEALVVLEEFMKGRS
jgi:hypothetical protein